MEKITYCACAGGRPTPAVNRGPDSSWVPFIERRNVVVWRRRHPEHEHLYSYKGMYYITKLYNWAVETDILNRSTPNLPKVTNQMQQLWFGDSVTSNLSTSSIKIDKFTNRSGWKMERSQDTAVVWYDVLFTE